MRILVVDVEPHRRELEQALAGLGAAIQGADDVDLAVQLYYEQPFDVVIVGVSPAFSGLPLLERSHIAALAASTILVAEGAKHTLLAQAIKLGVKQILLTPLDAAQLRAAVTQMLGHTADATPAAGAATATAESATPRAHKDLLLVAVDPHELDELRPLLPSRFSVESAASPGAALQACHDAAFRAVLLDAHFSTIHHVDMLARLRELEPREIFVAIYQRSKADRHDEARHAGYKDHLLRPYDAAAINELLFHLLDWRDLLPGSGTLFRPVAFPTGSPRLEQYYARLTAQAAQAIGDAANACESTLVLDLETLPQHSIQSAPFLASVQHHAAELGLDVRIVAPAGLIALLRASHVLQELHVYSTVAEALAATG